MIKTLLLLLVIDSTVLNIIEIRNLYENAANDKKANMQLIEFLADAKTDNALLLGYKGAAIMIEANHVLNPITKLNRFKRGKQLIEHAIKLNRKDIELRYIRFSIQTNVPGFLGYSSAINEDKKMLIDEIATLKDKDLKNRIISYLIKANVCTAEELKKINQWKNK